MNPPDQPTPALAPTPRTLEAAGTPSHDWEATADRLFIESQKLERELTAAKEEFARFKESTWEHFEYNRKHAVARSIERDNDKDELTRLRALSDQLSDNLSAVGAAYNAEKARAEKAEAELADHKTALEIANRSADEQMRYKREAESKVEQLNLELTALGDLAVGHWDDNTVGRVDALIPHETQVTYKKQLKTLFSASSELTRLRAEVERLKIIEEKFRQSPMWDVLAIVQTRNNWEARAEKAEAELANYKAALEIANSSADELVCRWRELRADRDEQKWLKECAIKRTGEVMAQRDALAADKARLDWLEKNWIHWPITQNEETIRAAIDAAMKGTP
jgi:hypothetical protein